MDWDPNGKGRIPP